MASVEEARVAEEQREGLLQKFNMNMEYVRKVQKIAESQNISFATETVNGYAPRFVRAAKTAVRVAFWTWLTGIAVWVLRRQDWLPGIYVGALNGMVITIIFNTSSNLASTVKSCIQSFIGMMLAICVAWVVYLMPDPSRHAGHSPAVPPTCNVGGSFAGSSDGAEEWFCGASAGLVTADNLAPSLPTFIAFLVYAIFVAVVLALNFVLAFKTFALVGIIGYLMHFANPSISSAGYMAVRWDSVMVVSVVIHLSGSAVAIMAMMLPPITATRSTKVLAARATKVSAELLAFVTEYYCGSEKTLKINVWNSQLERNQADMEEQTSELENSWWEIYDWGLAGTIRYLMKDHLRMLRDLDRRLAVMQLCVLREGFERTHKEVMAEVAGICKELVKSIGDLLMNCTISAADGVFTEEETKVLKSEKEAVEENLRRLAQEWQRVRRRAKQGALEEELRSESFFMLELSTCARVVVEFTEEIIDDGKRPKPRNLALEAIKNVFSRDKLKTVEFKNFILRNWISLMFSWWWACIAQNYSTALPINVVFMLTEQPGSMLMMNLEKLQASILGSLAGMVLYRAFHYCTPVFAALKLGSLFFWELLAMFTAKYTSEYATVGTLLAVYGGSKLMERCDVELSNGEVMMMQSTEFRALKSFTYAMCIVTVVDSLMRPEPACKRAVASLKKAQDVCFENLENFIEGKIEAQARPEIWESTTKVTDEVLKHLGEAEGLIGSATQEPRFAKGKFRDKLFSEQIKLTKELQMHAQVLIRRCQGGSGLRGKLTASSHWEDIKADFTGTIADTKKVCQEVMAYDGFGAMSPNMFDEIIGKAGVDRLENLRALVLDVQKTQGTTVEKDLKSLEDGEVTRLCVVIEMLVRLVQDMHTILVVSVQNM